MKLSLISLLCGLNLIIYAQIETSQVGSISKPNVDHFFLHSMNNKLNEGYLSILTYFDASKKSTLYYIKDSLTKEKVGLEMLNLPIIEIVSKAFSDQFGDYIVKSRIIIESTRKERILFPDKSKFTNDEERSKWNKNNLYCYKVKVPYNERKNLGTIIQQDIERYFKLKARIERRRVPCIVLTKIGNLDSLKSQDMSVAGGLKFPKDKGAVIRNGGIKTIVQLLAFNNSKLGYPVINETGYSERINVTIKNSLVVSDALIAELRTLGIGLSIEEREAEMIVVSDINN